MKKRDGIGVSTLHTFGAGSDASCSSSGNKEERAHVRKYSDFPGLPMSASNEKIYLFPASFIFLFRVRSFSCHLSVLRDRILLIHRQ